MSICAFFFVFRFRERVYDVESEGNAASKNYLSDVLSGAYVSVYKFHPPYVYGAHAVMDIGRHGGFGCDVTRVHQHSICVLKLSLSLSLSLLKLADRMPERGQTCSQIKMVMHVV
jgi:hypothetical protein